MGMLVTLYLISINVYTTLDAPPGRGFSYIELWMVGMQIPILVAMVEYGTILSLRKFQNNKIETTELDHKAFEKSENKDSITNLKNKNFLNIDMICMIISIVYIITFCVCYWLFLKV